MHRLYACSSLLPVLPTDRQVMEDKEMSSLEDRGIRYLNHILLPLFDKLLWLSQ